MTETMLVFGGKGFVGSNLTRIAKNFFEVKAFGSEVDVCDKSSVADIISEVAPKFVVNLAAISSIPESFSDPKLCWDVNFGGTFNILDGLHRANFTGSFLFVSSSQVYGQAGVDCLPIKEDNICLPSNPYGYSKLSAEKLCTQYSLFSDFKTVVARPFNHVGHGQSDKFVVPTIIRQIKNALSGKEKVLRLGDLNSTRDFLHVVDVSNAYLQLLRNGKNGEIYNVCSGEETKIATIVEELLDIAGVQLDISTTDYSVGDKNVQRVFGDNSKIFEQTSWKPEFNLRTTLEKCWAPEKTIN